MHFNKKDFQKDVKIDVKVIKKDRNGQIIRDDKDDE